MGHRTFAHPAAGAGDQAARLSFGILGPLRVLAGEHALDPGPRKQQIVLAALLCHANTPVPVDDLVDALWQAQPPRTARKNVQVYVSTLRGLLGRASSDISYELGGYVLRLEDDVLDVLAFERKARLGRDLRHGGQHAAGSRALGDALALWRGPILAGMRDVPMLGAAAQRLEHRFVGVLEDWAEAELAVDGAAAVIERVADVAHRNPFRERLRMVQMTALCQAGRRSEALAVYDEVRRSLAHEFGIGPSPAMDALYRAMLRDDEPSAVRPAPADPARRRTTATLLPRDLPAFTGRADCVRRLVDALTVNGERVAVVAGPVGVGKTTLAIHVAHLVGADFPDGRFLVRLRDGDGALRPVDEVLAELLWSSADASAAHGRHGDVRTLWRQWSATHRALVVVDDVRCESEIRPFLPDVGPGAVLATGPTRLAGLEPAYRLRVPPFTVEEALEFLGREIGRAHV
jgi:DNA-binding SARP family transcriptional activator